MKKNEEDCNPAMIKYQHVKHYSRKRTKTTSGKHLYAKKLFPDKGHSISDMPCHLYSKNKTKKEKRQKLEKNPGATNWPKKLSNIKICACRMDWRSGRKENEAEEKNERGLPHLAVDQRRKSYSISQTKIRHHNFENTLNLQEKEE